ncbi:MAG: butyrate kinase [Eggerthellaceae bacterium]|nr:butyrate kinase [Eggerthellaceae bacterium]
MSGRGAAERGAAVAASAGARRAWRVFAVNPGSTSTKVALFEGEEELFKENIAHGRDELAAFDTIEDQVPYREEFVRRALAERGVELSSIDAFVGRGGSSYSMEGGTYVADDLLVRDTLRAAGETVHPANMGPALAKALAEEAGAHAGAFVVSPPVTDEFDDVARVTGIEGVYRHSNLHALNLKETALRHGKLVGPAYAEGNYIVCHLGGGVSVSAHRRGRMVDGNDNSGGDGPFAPTRTGSVAVREVVKLVEGGALNAREVMNRTIRDGGYLDWLGTADAREVEQRVERGDAKAALVQEALFYQIVKEIGAMACALAGRVDAILLGGGLVHSESLVRYVREHCAFIAPIYAYPGEFEMEAMAAGATRILDGEEQPRRYSGRPVWSGFSFADNSREEGV